MWGVGSVFFFFVTIPNLYSEIPNLYSDELILGDTDVCLKMMI